MGRYLGFLALAGLLLTGCAASVSEKHYFASFDSTTPEPKRPVNFFRLTVDGKALFSRARYLAGFYDERAVDLFFNEIRTSESNTSTLFTGNLKEPGTDQVIHPLSPAVEDGAFVLILSTDADSVVNAIGSFAESNATAQAIANLIAKDKINKKVESDANVSFLKVRGEALAAQVGSLLTDAIAQQDRAAARSAYLRVLTALATALGHDNSFTSFADARQWFELERNASGL